MSKSIIHRSFIKQLPKIFLAISFYFASFTITWADGRVDLSAGMEVVVGNAMDIPGGTVIFADFALTEYVGESTTIDILVSLLTADGVQVAGQQGGILSQTFAPYETREFSVAMFAFGNSRDYIVQVAGQIPGAPEFDRFVFGSVPGMDAVNNIPVSVNTGFVEISRGIDVIDAVDENGFVGVEFDFLLEEKIGYQKSLKVFIDVKDSNGDHVSTISSSGELFDNSGTTIFGALDSVEFRIPFLELPDKSPIPQGEYTASVGAWIYDQLEPTENAKLDVFYFLPDATSLTNPVSFSIGQPNEICPTKNIDKMFSEGVYQPDCEDIWKRSQWLNFYSEILYAPMDSLNYALKKTEANRKLSKDLHKSAWTMHDIITANQAIAAGDKLLYSEKLLTLGAVAGIKNAFGSEFGDIWLDGVKALVQAHITGDPTPLAKYATKQTVDAAINIIAINSLNKLEEQFNELTIVGDLLLTYYKAASDLIEVSRVLGLPSASSVRDIVKAIAAKNNIRRSLVLGKAYDINKIEETFYIYTDLISQDYYNF